MTEDDPRAVADYALIGRLGQGGQGVVYLGRAPDGAQVAVKLLHADPLDQSGLRRQLAEEVELARRVARFCTAQVLAADVIADPPYVVSEYVAGPSLSALVRSRGPLSGPSLDRLAIGTLTALAAIHQTGVVHRDFKPANVLMAPEGPRVIDFGIARALEGTAVLTNSIAGTPAYMAPEQIAGAALGPAVDIFAWGATIVFAATGGGPFGNDSLRSVINRVRNDPPNLGELADPLREIVRECLEKDPSARPTAAQTLLRVLGVGGGRTLPPPDAAPKDAPAGDGNDTGPPAALPLATLEAAAIAAADTAARERATEEIYRSFPQAETRLPAPEGAWRNIAASPPLAAPPSPAAPPTAPAVRAAGRPEPAPAPAAREPRSRSVNVGLLIGLLGSVVAVAVIGFVVLLLMLGWLGG
ncbi:serine/threonine-protein kinase [Salinactinospora qingdaonensis]|uniref:Protein kinase domain-containing protein n=1 Tax=Salinactinospora qingdaonensis TaxID=702744 RepID=A0ABP7FLQ9_9ACTN